MIRPDGRNSDEIRQVKITRNYTKYAGGSVLIEMGDTKVICTANIEEGVPPFIRNTGTGWIKAEYSMLPMSTQSRKKRDSSMSKPDGRGQEIQRLIGRALRSVVDLELLGERTVWVDCDVIQADGGTRTASITGAFVALCDAVNGLLEEKVIKKNPIRNMVSAVSAGIVDGEAILDLCYLEDSSARVDMNVIMTDKGGFVELQGTGEESSFSAEELAELIRLARKGNKMLIAAQREALGEVADKLFGMIYERKAVIATGNMHKLKEIGEILGELGFEILSMKDVGLGDLEIEEYGRTFEHNSLIKAREIAQRTGLIAIGDDSGLEVDYLNGAPGIYSARYAGEHGNDDKNREKLLEEMKDAKEGERDARFVCAIGVAFPDKKEFVVRGAAEGYIGFEEAGSNGFGYDNLFITKEEGLEGKTFAELDPEVKNKVSHRKYALDKMMVEMRKRFDNEDNNNE